MREYIDIHKSETMMRNNVFSRVSLLNRGTYYLGSYSEEIDIISLTKLLWILFFTFLSIMLFQVLNKDFNHDEFEVVHTAWKILHGEKIYVDFFQHHHPLLYYLLIPILIVLGENVASIVAMRLVIFLMLLLIFVVTYYLSEKLFNRETGIISLSLLSITPIFVDNAIEIRPDVPQALCSLVSLLFLFIYFENKSLTYLTLSSFFLSLSFLFLQKAIFLIFLIGILLIVCAYKKQISYKDFLIYFFVLLLTIFPYYIYLVCNGSLYPYFIFNWALNARFLSQTSQLEILFGSLGHAILTNSLIWVFYIWGLRSFIKNLKQKQFAFLSLGLLISVLFVRTPHQQYFIMSIPLIAIISAFTVYSIFLNRYKLLLVLYVSISLFLFFSFDKVSTNHLQFQKINYVLSITNSKDFVYDGNINFNVFRKDISFFWFSVNPKVGGLITYKTFKNYQYDIYHLIDTFKPKIISNNYIDNLKDDRLVKHYVQSHLYNDLFIRIDHV